MLPCRQIVISIFVICLVITIDIGCFGTTQKEFKKRQLLTFGMKYCLFTHA